MVKDGTAEMLPIKKSEPFPAGWLSWQDTLHYRCVKANGATVLRSDYPSLVKYATDNNLWTSDSATEKLKYGVGDGSTTMALPDWTGLVPQCGIFSGVPLEAGLPNITGYFDGSLRNTGIPFKASGSFYTDGTAGTLGNVSDIISDSEYSRKVNFSATKSSAVYGKSDKVQSPAGELVAQIYY